MIFSAYSDTTEGLFDISIISSGHIFAQKGRSIHRPNGRADWLLFYVAKGCERFTLNTQMDANEGSFVIFKPGEKQEHIYIGDKTGEFYYVHFNAPYEFDLFGLQSSVIYNTKPSTKICDLFEEIINELLSKHICYEKICVSKFFNIMGLLSRRTADLTNPHKRYMDKMSYIIQTMNREFQKDYSLEEYANMCQMSKFHFLRIFKDITGSSPMEYKNKLRIEHAKEMLEDNDIPINEIGAKVGFSSPSYFCDAFKKKQVYLLQRLEKCLKTVKPKSIKAFGFYLVRI